MSGVVCDTLEGPLYDAVRLWNVSMLVIALYGKWSHTYIVLLWHLKEKCTMIVVHILPIHTCCLM